MSDGRDVALGQPSADGDSGSRRVASSPTRAEELRADGQTVMFVAIDGAPAGLVGVADPIKESTPEAIRMLHEEGIRIVMMTGDSETTAQAVAKQLGIDEVMAEVLPDQKADIGQATAGRGSHRRHGRRRHQRRPGAGAGPRRHRHGNRHRRRHGERRRHPGQRRSARHRPGAQALRAHTMANIKQNLFFAFVYNTAGVPIAAGVLYPTFGLLLSPVLAAAAMSASSVSVIGNALRLRRTRV